MINEWNFPHNGYGQVRGVSDAGIETFTGTEIQSLAREICQNSLDAAVEGSNATVRVDFEQYRIPTSGIPGYEQYASKIKKAYDYWSKKNSEKTIKVLTKALNSINKPNANVLRMQNVAVEEWLQDLTLPRQKKMRLKHWKQKLQEHLGVCDGRTVTEY